MFHWLKKEWAIRQSDRLAGRGQSEEALSRIESVLSVCPNDPTLIVQKAWLLIDMKLYADAVNVIEKALSTSPRHSVLHMLKGEALYHCHEYEKAKEALLQALALSGDNIRVEYWLGLVHVALNDLDRASRYFESSIRYDSHLVQSRLLSMAERYLFLAQARSDKM